MCPRSLAVIFSLLASLIVSSGCFCAQLTDSFPEKNCCPSSHSDGHHDHNPQNTSACPPCLECGTLFQIEKVFSASNVIQNPALDPENTDLVPEHFNYIDSKTYNNFPIYLPGSNTKKVYFPKLERGPPKIFS